MDILKSLKAVFLSAEAPASETETVEVKHEEMILADGTTKVYISSLEVGGTIKVLDADGNEVDANPGDYVLEDGRVIIVKEAGIIAEIREAMMMDEESKKVENKEVENTELTEIKNSLLFLANEIKTLKDESALLKIENSKLKAENTALNVVPSPKAKEVKFKKVEDKNPAKISKFAEILSKAKSN